MAESEGDDDIDFESITSSQRSLLKNCPFSESESHLLLQPPSPTPTKSHGGGERDTDSYTTEILETPISTTVVQTPIISFSSPTSLDSINDEDVFRTPPENASLSSAADSEPAFRVSAIKSKSKSPSFETHTTPFYVSPSLTPGNVRVPETKSKSKSPSSEANTTPLYTSPSRTPGNVRVSATKSKSPSSETDTSPFSASPFVTPGNVRVSATKSPFSETHTTPFSASPYSETGTMPFSASPSLTPGNVRILETNRLSDFVEPVTEEMLPSPPYFAAEVVRFPILSSQPYNAAVDFGVPISSPPSIAAVDVRITETDKISEEETPIPFKEIIEALLRNNGENINERYDSFSFVEALKKCGLKFP
ncbi:unnamed protein product [Cochlearia groenlandica]